MQNQEPVEEVKPIPKVYSYFDLLQFESPNKYSGFGKMVISNKASAPKYGFGTADRQKQAKVFQSKALSKTFVGKNILLFTLLKNLFLCKIIKERQLKFMHILLRMYLTIKKHPNGDLDNFLEILSTQAANMIFMKDRMLM